MVCTIRKSPKESPRKSVGTRKTYSTPAVYAAAVHGHSTHPVTPGRQQFLPLSTCDMVGCKTFSIGGWRWVLFNVISTRSDLGWPSLISHLALRTWLGVCPGWWCSLWRWWWWHEHSKIVTSQHIALVCDKIFYPERHGGEIIRFGKKQMSIRGQPVSRTLRTEDAFNHLETRLLVKREAQWH